MAVIQRERNGALFGVHGLVRPKNYLTRHVSMAYSRQAVIMSGTLTIGDEKTHRNRKIGVRKIGHLARAVAFFNVRVLESTCLKLITQTKNLQLLY